MANKYHTIGLIGKPDHEGALATISTLHQYLEQHGYTVMIESKVATVLNKPDDVIFDIVSIGERAELAIVVGGDGYMLGAARVLASHDIDVVGVNRGNLGFLTDLSPDNLIEPLEEILAGKSKIEYRSLLYAQVYRHGKLKSANAAMNEAVLHPGKVASMMEFAVHLDDTFMFSQRSDGLIVSTPTGSTAYSMSAGGPIMTPTLNALTLVPMFPHTLTSRPIVVDGDAEIKIVVAANNHEELQVSCDGHIILAVMPGDEIKIRKSKDKLRLVHPLDHDYFNVLRTKLSWGNKVY